MYHAISGNANVLIRTYGPHCTSEPRSTSPDGQAGRAHNVRHLTGLIASGYVQAVWRVPVITPNGIEFSFLVDLLWQGFEQLTVNAIWPRQFAILELIKLL